MAKKEWHGIKNDGLLQNVKAYGHYKSSRIVHGIDNGYMPASHTQSIKLLNNPNPVSLNPNPQLTLPRVQCTGGCMPKLQVLECL